MVHALRVVASKHRPLLHRLGVILMISGAGFAWVWALARFYRRFMYRYGQDRVWGLADDMYISACFGRSLFSGDGFVWYSGAPRVEGISNPLWSVVIGALHKLPGFSEDRLGLFVIALNGVLLFICVVLFVQLTGRAAMAPSSPPTLQLWAAAGALLLLPWSSSLAYWSAEGFEVAWLAVLTFMVLLCAVRARTTLDCISLAVGVVIGFATRMDFIVLTVPAFLIVALQRRAQLRGFAWMLIVLTLGIAAQQLARRAYYGEWMPNTYYLKMTGWTLSARLERGFHQNRWLLVIAPIAWLPLAVPSIRKDLGQALLFVAAAWLGFAGAVAYSTYAGGDSWRLFAGYDRHTVIGGVLLAWGNVMLFATARKALPRLIAGVWGMLIAVTPTLAENGVQQVREGLLAEISPLRANESEWIRYGKRFREVSEPGARIALCPAGAIVYFSHRGAVDLLGKVEPIVAHLTVSTQRTGRSACWRYAPGHNKGDDAAVFEARQPEFARGRPPIPHREQYLKIKQSGTIYFVRKGTPLAQAAASH